VQKLGFHIHSTMTDSQYFSSKLQAKRIIILGGSAGIGLAVAKGCVESGAHVTISSSRQSRIDSAINTILETYPSASGRVQGHACDLSTGDVEKNLETLFEKVGEVDHIVYTAGDSLDTTPLEAVTLERLHTAGQIRAFAALLTAKIGSKYLTKSSTCSITFSTGSIAEKPIPGGWAMLALFGAGLIGLTRQLALDLAPIRVNIVAPGVLDTELWAGMPQHQKEAVMKSHAEKMPTRQIGLVEDVAEAYLYLLRDANATGSVVHSNSGVLLV
jgi:NAD(P)-dependent dehydrogenase (short-subunit alcohol dehydrogenase family)